MAINKIEIQDAEGNIYHPHTTSDVVFYNKKPIEDILLKFENEGLLKSEPYILDAGNVDIIDLGDIESGNYLFGVSINPNQGGSSHYMTSKLFLLTKETGYEDNQVLDVITLAKLGNSTGVPMTIPDSSFSPTFAINGHFTKPTQTKSSVHIKVSRSFSGNNILKFSKLIRL